MWQPPGPISQCIDTNREDQFGIPLRKYRFRASAGRSIEFGDREDQVPKDMRLSRRTARCGTDLNERYHQDMKQFLKTWPKTKRSSLRVQSAGSLESPALPVRMKTSDRSTIYFGAPLSVPVVAYIFSSNHRKQRARTPVDSGAGSSCIILFFQAFTSDNVVRVARGWNAIG